MIKFTIWTRTYDNGILHEWKRSTVSPSIEAISAEEALYVHIAKMRRKQRNRKYEIINNHLSRRFSEINDKIIYYQTAIIKGATPTDSYRPWER